MMHLRAAVAAICLLFGLAAPAAADDYVRFLDLRCDPTISLFSVREGGTWAFDGPFDSVIPVDRGATRAMDPERTQPSQGDLMARCVLGGADRPWVFEVRRIGYYPAIRERGMCTGGVRATFAITLNGAVLSQWSDGYRECVAPDGVLPPPEGRSVSFDGGFVDICGATSVQHGPTGRSMTIECRSEMIDVILRDAR